MADSDNDFYAYNPSKVAASIFVALFLLTTLVHVFQTIRHRTWYFIPMIVGGFLECGGYLARIQSSIETPDWKLGTYIAQVLLILVAPALIAASIYMTLGRIILATGGEQYSLISKRWLTKIFVLGDILSFVVLSSGSGMLSDINPSTVKNGEHIVLGGLFIQIIFFGFFVNVAFVWHKRMLRNKENLLIVNRSSWVKQMCVLYSASVLILIRSIIRVVEFAQGQQGYILTHEAFLYVFDALLVLIAMSVFNVIHPQELTRQKPTDMVEEGELDLRPSTQRYI